MTVTIYGIKACDTMKKAFTWLDEAGIDYTFHDYKKAGAPTPKVAAWIKREGWEVIINRRGTTWRKLPEDQRATMDAKGALQAALDNPSLIKRPVVEYDGGLLVGFNADEWAQALK